MNQIYVPIFSVMLIAGKLIGNQIWWSIEVEGRTIITINLADINVPPNSQVITLRFQIAISVELRPVCSFKFFTLRNKS